MHKLAKSATFGVEERRRLINFHAKEVGVDPLAHRLSPLSCVWRACPLLRSGTHSVGACPDHDAAARAMARSDYAHVYGGSHRQCSYPLSGEEGQMSSTTGISVVIAILLMVVSRLFLPEHVRDILAGASGWIVFIIMLPVMIDLYKKRKNK